MVSGRQPGHATELQNVQTRVYALRAKIPGRVWDVRVSPGVPEHFGQPGAGHGVARRGTQQRRCDGDERLARRCSAVQASKRGVRLAGRCIGWCPGEKRGRGTGEEERERGG